MEVILLHSDNDWYSRPVEVLILVFMEVILLRRQNNSRRQRNIGFNPCFYGSYSFTEIQNIQGNLPQCFNPCFYGSYSFTCNSTCNCTYSRLVLILVFMEVILLQRSQRRRQLWWGVLILVFMEVILLLQPIKTSNQRKRSFNPCFYGSYSFTQFLHIPCLGIQNSFNPCFYGSYSFTRRNSTH